MANTWGKKWKQWQILFSWAPKSLWTVTAAMKLKDAPWMESYDKPRQCVKKQRSLCQQSSVYKAMVFPVVMYGYESWTIKKAEYQRIDAYNWGLGEDSWESLGLQGDQTNQSWRKFIGLMLKLQYFGHLMPHWKSPWCWERLKAGGEGDNRGWDG